VEAWVDQAEALAVEAPEAELADPAAVGEVAEARVEVLVEDPAEVEAWVDQAEALAVEAPEAELAQAELADPAAREEERAEVGKVAEARVADPAQVEVQAGLAAEVPVAAEAWEPSPVNG
jgi:hypothetical protein